jgi:hypothetical protein
LQRERLTMRRTAIAAAWVFGATVPLLAAVVFMFGCCALPFHAYVHKAIPLCHLAMAFISGETADHHDGTQQQMPARQKQEPVKRIVTDVARTFHLSALSSERRTPAVFDAITYRSFITLGALRCDQDVGLYLLVSTLLI